MLNVNYIQNGEGLGTRLMGLCSQALLSVLYTTAQKFSVYSIVSCPDRAGSGHETIYVVCI